MYLVTLLIKKIIDSPLNLNSGAIYIKENTDHTQTLSELINKIIDSTTHEK